MAAVAALARTAVGTGEASSSIASVAASTWPASLLIPRSGPREYNVALRRATAATAHGWQGALSVLEALRRQAAPPLRPTPDVVNRTIVANACAKAAAWRSALVLVAQMQEDALRPDAASLCAAMDACARASRWRAAVALLVEVRSKAWQSSQVERTYSCKGNATSAVRSVVIAHSIAATACERAAHWRAALHLLAALDETAFAVPDRVCYGAVMSACEKAHRWEWALQLLETMHLRRVMANVVCYGAAISACGGAQHWQRAVELLIDMHTARVAHSVASCAAAVTACERGQQWRRALFLFAEGQEEGLSADVASYTSAIAACDAGAHWRGALALLESMCTSVSTGDEHTPNVCTCNAALSACGRAGQWRVAWQIFRAMRSPMGGKLDGWLSTPLPAADAVSFATMVTACASQSRWASALALLSEWKAASHRDGAVARGERSVEFVATSLGGVAAESRLTICRACMRAQQAPQALLFLLSWWRETAVVGFAVDATSVVAIAGVLHGLDGGGTCPRGAGGAAKQTALPSPRRQLHTATSVQTAAGVDADAPPAVLLAAALHEVGAGGGSSGVAVAAERAVEWLVLSAENAPGLLVAYQAASATSAGARSMLPARLLDVGLPSPRKAVSLSSTVPNDGSDNKNGRASSVAGATVLGRGIAERLRLSPPQLVSLRRAPSRLAQPHLVWPRLVSSDNKADSTNTATTP
eukprot:TRINITY_DN38459_c0_g1_i1.p1 TRINITY_DN38459_c0_g1~~TRINITY_DN38459_c0_g1_i1.p1  ORF type:complete len:704 (+),score=126.63 TRINITY_DN38459_c0_g1_i1:219-2330(+)